MDVPLAVEPPKQIQASAWTIVEYLQREGWASVKDLEDLLGLTRTAVREHLATLEAGGYLEKRTVHSGVGRPHLEYANSEQTRSLFACHCGSLAVTLLGEISSLVTAETLVSLMSRVSEKVALDYSSHMQTTAVRSRVHELAVLMQRQGIICSVHTEAGRDYMRLELFNCPYHELAAEHPQICDMDRDMISQAVGAPVELLDCIMEDAGSCNFGFQLNPSPERIVQE